MTGDPIDDATRAIDYVLNRLGPPPDRDPATQEWRQALGESTSARLRRVEAELGSALNALTQARQERDEARAKAAHWLNKTRELARDLAAVGVIADTLCVEAGQCGWRPLAVQLMREQEEAGVELGHQRALIDELIADRARLRAEVIRVRGQEAGLP